jgi:protein disulfide-isomerase A1
MRQKNGLVVQTVSTTEEANRILRTNSVIVMGFLDTLEVFSPCLVIFSFPSNE